MAMDDLFRRIHEEIPGVTGAATGSLDGAWEGDGSLAEQRAALLALAGAWAQTRDALGGAMDFGSNDEVLASASRGYLLLKMSHERRRFVAVQLSSNGNIGYLRFRMRDYLRRAAQG